MIASSGMFSSYRAVAGCWCLFALALSEIRKDEILSLPGLESRLPSRQFSGYLNFTRSKRMHYWVVESESNPDNAPVVLWLNGGPGCSSLDGFIYENGPFRIDPANHSRLIRFEYTWAKLANMVYLESPVGVGFSFSENASEYVVNDDITASDNVAALNAFFESWPEWKTHDFFIMGESYAGVYVPTLAEAVLWAKGNGTWKGAPLKGIAVGNGCAGTEIGSCGGQRDFYMTELILGTAFINASLKKQIRKACSSLKSYKSLECQAKIQAMQETVGHINLYNIYGECISGSSQQLYASMHAKAPGTWLRGSTTGPDACIDSILGSAYFNQPSVIEAMHVKKQSFPWSTCGNQIQYTGTRKNLPRDTYPFLVQHINVLIYSGDWDACVPYTDSEAWTEGMGFAVKSPWHAWTFDGGAQVAGYATTYDVGAEASGSFAFATVKGGRHEVPETAPGQAFELLRRVLTATGFDHRRGGNPGSIVI
eukprot:TRINITY_DN47990_c0_g1_i1.p1 TRINITY_DN47990_c0_g1~~TRINITY_DN47990_c0_g1_i1.p1  ORF type:complete len:481 (+),score=52.82 TRINITY_DN47990_c0_g1_i1:66-1508(+)